MQKLQNKQTMQNKHNLIKYINQQNIRQLKKFKIFNYINKICSKQYLSLLKFFSVLYLSIDLFHMLILNINTKQLELIEKIDYLAELIKLVWTQYSIILNEWSEINKNENISNLDRQFSKNIDSIIEDASIINEKFQDMLEKKYSLYNQSKIKQIQKLQSQQKFLKQQLNSKKLNLQFNQNQNQKQKKKQQQKQHQKQKKKISKQSTEDLNSISQQFEQSALSLEISFNSLIISNQGLNITEKQQKSSEAVINLQQNKKSQIKNSKNEKQFLYDLDISRISFQSLQLSQQNQNKRLFDHFNLQQKKKIFFYMCQYSKPKKRNPKQMQANGEILNPRKCIIQMIRKKGLLIELLQSIKCATVAVQHTLITRLFLLFLFKKQQNIQKEHVGTAIELKIKQFRKSIQNNQLESCLQKNRNSFQFDSSLTEQQNFIIYKFTIYYIFSSVTTQQLIIIFQNLFNNSNQIDQFVGIQFKEKSSDQQKIGLIQNKQSQVIKSLEANNIVQNHSINLPVQYNSLQKSKLQNQNCNLNQISKIQYVQKLNENQQFGGYFFVHQKNGMIGFQILKKPSQFRQFFKLDNLLKLDCPLIQFVSLPMRDIGTQGLHKICCKWPHLKTLEVWACNIKSLQGSGLQLLKELQVLSLSNNQFQSDTVDFFLNHTWQNLIELRITFADGSKSYDKLLPEIKNVFPKLEILYARQLKNLSHSTFLSLIQLRQLQIFVYFRIQQALIPLLIQGGFRSVDFQGTNDIALFERVHGTILQNQKIIIEQKLKIIENQTKILENQEINLFLKDKINLFQKKGLKTQQSYV